MNMDPGAFPDDNTHNGPQNYERSNLPVEDLRAAVTENDQTDWREREREREREYY